MRGVFFAAVAACALSGCAGDREILSQVPQNKGAAPVEYQALAACVAARLDQPGLIKNDFPTEHRIRLSVDSGGVRYFEIDLRGVGPSATEWSVSVPNTLWGPFAGAADKATTAIGACSAGKASGGSS